MIKDDVTHVFIDELPTSRLESRPGPGVSKTTAQIVTDGEYYYIAEDTPDGLRLLAGAGPYATLEEALAATFSTHATRDEAEASICLKN